MNPRQCDRYRAWAEPFSTSVAGDVGVLDSKLFHVWHGILPNRQGRTRHERLSRAGFDPFADIAHAPEGPWRWSSQKPQLHDFVRSYFTERREDG